MNMEKGQDFQHAWQLVQSAIPTHHFQNLEKETMEILNRKIKYTQLFVGISISLLALASFFKIMHFPGSSQLLVGFFIFTSFTLLFGSIRNVYLYRKNKGRFVIFFTTFVLIAFISFLCFKILHLPGGDQLLIISVLGIGLTFPALGIYFFQSRRNLKDHLLIKLLENNQKVVENTAIAMLVLGLIFNYTSWMMGEVYRAGVVFFIFSVVLYGLYAYSLTWHHYVLDKANATAEFILLISSSLALIMFLLPLLGPLLSAVLRNFLAYGALIIFIGIVIIHYAKFYEGNNKSTLIILSSLIFIYTIIKFGLNLFWLPPGPEFMHTFPAVNLGFIAVLCVLLIVFRKHQLFKSLLMITIASQMIPIV